MITNRIIRTMVVLMLTSRITHAQNNEISQNIIEYSVNDPSGYGRLVFVKEVNIPLRKNINNKATAASPIGKGKGFRANDSNFNPPDGAVAISNSGTIIVATNSGIEYRNKNGDTLNLPNCWKHLLYDTTCVDDDTIRFSDPRLLYDNQKDRFILVILEIVNIENSAFGNRNNGSIIHVLFSQDNTPNRKTWHHYKIKGEVGQNNTLVDYPYIGITNNDLFISVNVFRDTSKSISPGMPPTYSTLFKAAMVVQIAKDSGYVGGNITGSIARKVWYNLKIKKTSASSFETINNIMPVSNGQGGYLKKGYLLATQKFGANNDSLLYLFTIDSAVYLNPKSYKYKVLKVNEKYFEPIYVKQGVGSIAMLDGGDNRMQGGFYLNNRIHVVYQTKKRIAGTNKFQNGLQYVRINVVNNSVVDTTVYCISNLTHFCYPTLVSSGQDSTSMLVTIPYLFAGDTIYPSIGAVNIDYPVSGPKTISDTINIRVGTSLVSVAYEDTCGTLAPFGASLSWGDYIGVQRKYNGNLATCKVSVWAYGMFGNNKDCTIADTNAYGLKRGWFGWVQEIGDTCLKTNIKIVSLTNKTIVFPNPTKGVLNIQPLSLNDSYTYALTNLQGVQLDKIFNAVGVQIIDTKNLASGLYVLKIINITTNTISYEKIIVNH
jgi:hypothetical protein